MQRALPLLLAALVAVLATPAVAGADLITADSSFGSGVAAGGQFVQIGGGGCRRAARGQRPPRASRREPRGGGGQRRRRLRGRPRRRAHRELRQPPVRQRLPWLDR